MEKDQEKLSYIINAQLMILAGAIMICGVLRFFV